MFGLVPPGSASNDSPAECERASDESHRVHCAEEYEVAYIRLRPVPPQKVRTLLLHPQVAERHPLLREGASGGQRFAAGQSSVQRCQLEVEQAAEPLAERPAIPYLTHAVRNRRLATSPASALRRTSVPQERTVWPLSPYWLITKTRSSICVSACKTSAHVGSPPGISFLHVVRAAAASKNPYIFLSGYTVV